MISAIISLLPILLGLLMIAAAVWEYMTWKTRFSKWSYGGGRSLGAVKKHGDVGPRLAYKFNVDGKTYEGVSSYMKDTVPPVGEHINIYYDPKNPDNSEWYSAGLHKYLMMGSGLIGAFVLWMAL